MPRTTLEVPNGARWGAGIRCVRGSWASDELPMIYCFATCAASIRTIPALQHDVTKMEDVNTEGEDHAADEWRYACMSGLSRP